MEDKQPLGKNKLAAFAITLVLLVIVIWSAVWVYQNYIAWAFSY